MPAHSDANPSPYVSQDHPFPTPSDYDIADKKKPVWNKPSNTSAEVDPFMGPADSWPALTLSARAESWPVLSLSASPSSNKSPSLDSSSKALSDGSSSSSSMPPPQVGGTPFNSTSIANAGSSVAATSSENYTVSGQRKPFRRDNFTSISSSSNISNPPNATPAPPLNTCRDQNHSQRGGGSYGSGASRNSQRNRSSSFYPRGEVFHHGNRHYYEHGNQSGYSHRNYTGSDMHLQPQRSIIGMVRPQMLMGPPSFPASSAQYMAAPKIGSYGGGPGPMLYPDYAQHVFMPHTTPQPMALLGPFPPLQMYYPSIDAVLHNKILTQVDYYFSADNLSRDEYLRRQMNDEGWVPVRVIAGFTRLAEMTNNIQTILEALRSSEVVEIKGETLRRRGDWDKYVLRREPSKSGTAAAAAASNNASLLSQVESMTLSEGSREKK